VSLPRFCGRRREEEKVTKRVRKERETGKCESLVLEAKPSKKT
jgi:hypothetical protein